MFLKIFHILIDCKPSEAFMSTSKTKVFRSLNCSFRNGNLDVVMVYKTTPHDHTSCAYVITSSHGGLYKAVPPSTFKEEKETSIWKGKHKKKKNKKSHKKQMENHPK